MQLGGVRTWFLHFLEAHVVGPWFCVKDQIQPYLEVAGPKGGGSRGMMAPAARCGTDRCPLVPMSQAGHSGCFCGLRTPTRPHGPTVAPVYDLSVSPSILPADREPWLTFLVPGDFCV